MNVNEIKLEIKDLISEIEKTLPRNWGRSFHHELMSNSIDSLEYTIKRVTRKYKNYKVFAIITLSILLVSITFPLIYSDIQRLNDTKLAASSNCGYFLNVNSYYCLILPSIFCLIQTFRLDKFKVYLEKKIILIRLLDNIDRK
jgi:hypothetical protein